MTFLQPIYLLGLLAAPLPLLFHFLRHRQRGRRVFSSIRLLRAARGARPLRSRLEEWLLAGVRCAVLVLLSLGLAQPVWPGPERSSGTAEASGDLVLLLDLSWSMAWEDGPFQAAIDRARELIGGTDGEVVVLTAGPEGALVLDSRRLGRPGVLGGLEKLAPGWGGTDLEAVLREGLRVAEELTAPRIDLVLLSDLRAPLPSRPIRLPERIRLLLVRLPWPEAVNRGVSRIEIGPGPVIPGQPILGRVWFHQKGSEGSGPWLPPRLVIEGSPVRTLELEGSSVKGPLEFQIPSQGPGLIAGWIELSGDRLSRDDRGYFAVTVPEPRLVTVVASGAMPPSLQAILGALEAWGQVTLGSAGLVPDRLGEGVLLVVGQPAAPARVASWVQTTWQTGGEVIFVPTGPGDRPIWYRDLMSRLNLPLAMSPWRDLPRGTYLSVQGGQALGLPPQAPAPRIDGYLPMDILSSPAWKVEALLQVEDGHPWLVRAEEGGRRALVWGGPPRLAGDPRAAGPLLVPIWHGLLRPGLTGTRIPLVGEPVPSFDEGPTFLSGPPDESWWVLDPTGRRLFPGKGAPAAGWPGIYRVEGPEGARAAYAVNVDPKELDWPVWTAERLEEQLLPPTRWLMGDGSSVAELMDLPGVSGRPIVRPLLVFALLLLVLEGFLARRPQPGKSAPSVD